MTHPIVVSFLNSRWEAALIWRGFRHQGQAVTVRRMEDVLASMEIPFVNPIANALGFRYDCHDYRNVCPVSNYKLMCKKRYRNIAGSPPARGILCSLILTSILASVIQSFSSVQRGVLFKERRSPSPRTLALRTLNAGITIPTTLSDDICRLQQSMDL